MINLWLDDKRPAPEGWTHVYTVEGAIRLIKSGQVQKASLDHDLGLCSPCKKATRPDCTACDGWGFTDDATTDCEQCNGLGYIESTERIARNCQCMTGYKLCLWMAENNKWPKEKPTVHSANPVGKFAMEAIIERYFPNGI